MVMVSVGLIFYGFLSGRKLGMKGIGGSRSFLLVCSL